MGCPWPIIECKRNIFASETHEEERVSRIRAERIERVNAPAPPPKPRAPASPVTAKKTIRPGEYMLCASLSLPYSHEYIQKLDNKLQRKGITQRMTPPLTRLKAFCARPLWIALTYARVCKILVVLIILRGRARARMPSRIQSESALVHPRACPAPHHSHLIRLGSISLTRISNSASV